MDTSKIVLFNGPALSGKDSVVEFLSGEGLQFESSECKKKLHELTMEYFSLPEERYWEIYNSRVLKENPLEEFTVPLWVASRMEEKVKQYFGYTYRLWNGESPFSEVYLSSRKALILISEFVIKPSYGGDYFGRCRAESIDLGGNQLYIDGSCGFAEELIPLIIKLGQENILLIRVHRPGHTFEGDSRDYILGRAITNTHDVHNDGTEAEYNEKVKTLVEDFIGEEIG